MATATKSDAGVTRLTSKGQVTIPADIRQKLGVKPGDEVMFVEIDGEIRLRRRIRREDIAKWRGYLKHLAGRTSDELVAEMRDG
ncbi:MAG: AbrB/MazE/SpoVT family DNA-binding domain-containing protein [Dehalococcoidia bacterium]